MIMNKFSSVVFIFVMTSISFFPAVGSVQIDTTRVIYHSEEKNVSVQVSNPGQYPVLLQSWIDNGNPDVKPGKIRSQFILTPPLTRVNAGAGQTLRLSVVNNEFPADRESIFWLNVLEIPPVNDTKSNQIQVAFRTRIKILYRPHALDDKGAQRSPADLRWNQQGKNITLTNPTPYFVSLLRLTLQQNGKEISIPAEMIPPQKSMVFSLPQDITIDSSKPIIIDSINDYGAVTSQQIQQL